MAIPLKTVMAAIVRLHGSVRGLSTTETAILDAHAGAIVDDIADQWPVDTSTSRDAWTHILDNSAGNVGFTLINDVEYAEFVHRAGEGPDPLYETLLPEVVRAHAADLNADMIDAIRETEARYQALRKAGDKRALSRALSERGTARASRIAA
jgi:hypothetical protein